ncbi:MAG: alpha/beta hydrolase [Bryobacteraceae bacterium]
MPPSEGFLKTADGARLYFRKTGTGPYVIFPNGLYLFDDFERFADRRTLVFYDVRNRGRSDLVTDGSKLVGSIPHDVDDLDAVRRHFGIARFDVIAHSYIGVLATQYAIKYAPHVNRAVLIGPMQPNPATEYPAHLTGADATLSEVFSKLGQLAQERQSRGLHEITQQDCEEFWSILRPIYVVNPADAGKIAWGRCDLPNERNFMQYFSENILPSIHRLRFSAETLAPATAPVLIVHGARDRSAPYGGGRDWALIFPNARLLTVQNAAHAPWIEAPELVLGSIETFLDGEWPSAAQKLVR